MGSRPRFPAVDAAATESDILRAFTDLEDKCGLGYVLHVRDGRGQRIEGCPDVIAILPDYVGGLGIIGFFEIKTQRDRLRHRQVGILAALDACSGVVSGIVRPNPRDGEIGLDEALRRLGVELA